MDSSVVDTDMHVVCTIAQTTKPEPLRSKCGVAENNSEKLKTKPNDNDWTIHDWKILILMVWYVS